MSASTTPDSQYVRDLLAEYAAIHARMTALPEPTAAEQDAFALREAEIVDLLRPFGLLPTGEQI